MAAGRRPLLWLALACIAPFIASTVLYYAWTPTGRRVNYGTLIEPKKLPLDGLIVVPRSDLPDTAIRGKWLLLVADAPACDVNCQAKLYATRQSRTMTGKERDRIVRVWLLTAEGLPDPALLAQHPDLVVVRGDAALAAALPSDASTSIHIVDPLGNLILRYPERPDIRGMYNDLVRLLTASSIG